MAWRRDSDVNWGFDLSIQSTRWIIIFVPTIGYQTHALAQRTFPSKRAIGFSGSFGFVPQLGIKGAAQGLLMRFARRQRVCCPEAKAWKVWRRTPFSAAILVWRGHTDARVLALQDDITAAALPSRQLEGWSGSALGCCPGLGRDDRVAYSSTTGIQPTPPTQRNHSITSNRGADPACCLHPYLPRGSALACRAARCGATGVCQTMRTNCSSWQLQSARPLP